MDTVQLLKTFNRVLRRRGKAAAIKAVIRQHHRCSDTAALLKGATADIVDDVAADYEVQPKDIYGHVRNLFVDAARNECYWLARRLRWSYRELGKMFRRGHVAVMSGCRAFERRLAAEPLLRRRMGVDENGVALAKTDAPAGVLTNDATPGRAVGGVQ